MYKRLDDQLRVIRMSGEKPNFAELARIYDCDYRTVKKHYESGEIKKLTRNKSSKLDSLSSLISAKLKIKGTTVRGVYEMLIDENMYDGTYSNFRKYVKKHNLQSKEKTDGHPRFETLPAVQAQADWKEDITITTKYGEVITFNVFNIVLGYSRLSYFEMSKSKEQNDVHRCLINAFRYFGGVPKEILFDNMTTASVHIGKSKKRRINPKLSVFSRDFGFEPRLCKPRASYTKGKVETKNKIVDWIRAYENDIEDEKHLAEIIKRINIKANNYISQATNEPPTLLFQTEKEYLSPLPPQTVIDTYQSSFKTTVQKDSTIYYKGNRYSVDPALIGETVGYEIIDHKLHIYYNLKLVTVHEIDEGKRKIKYHEDHYKKMMKTKVRDEDLDEIVRNNLAALDKLTGG